MDTHMITTTDNPYNYFTQFDDWYAFDQTKGYYSLELLARVAPVSDEMTEAEESDAIEAGIEEIVRENVSGVHTKVRAPSTLDLAA